MGWLTHKLETVFSFLLLAFSHGGGQDGCGSRLHAIELADTRPRCRTTTRSLKVINSDISEVIKRIEMPSAVQTSINW